MWFVLVLPDLTVLFPQMKDFAAEPLTALSKVSLRAGHTLSAAKSRIEFLHKDIGTMRRLGALVLCGQDLIGPLERPTVDTLNRVFARAPQQEQSELKLIASAAVRVSCRAPRVCTDWLNKIASFQLS